MRFAKARLKSEGLAPCEANRFSLTHPTPVKELKSLPKPTEAFGNLFATELLEQLDRLGDDRLRDIAAKKLEGYSNVEIAKQLGVAVRTVERKLGRIRTCWEGEGAKE